VAYCAPQLNAQPTGEDMRTLIALLPLLLASPLALADDVLTAEESAMQCAESLPKHLACKAEFCTAIVKIRAKGDKKADLKAMEAKCLEEIAVDGAADLATRKAKCEAWHKDRPITMKRADVKEMDACWAKASCKEKIDCWSPKMAKMLESSPPKKK
jgi:hypothetical protein